MRASSDRREEIAVMILQAIICQKEISLPDPKQAASLAVEHTNCLLNELDKSSTDKVRKLFAQK